MANKNYFACWDTETSAKDPNNAQILSIGCVIIDPKTLDIIPNSEFYSMVQPEDEGKVEAKALEVNKLKLEDLRTAPQATVVLNNFASYLKKYSIGANKWGKVIPTGYNILNYDMIVMERALKVNKLNLDLWHPTHKVDIMTDFFRWFHHDEEITSLSLDSMRDYLGISRSNAHNALGDAMDCGKIWIRLLKLYKSIKVKFKGSFQ